MSDTPSTTFYLVRHGQTDWNVERRIQGQTDIPLNDMGRREAAELALTLQSLSFSACFSSDLQRAYETLSILTTNFPEPPALYADKRLRERHFGPWEGHLCSEFYQASPAEQAVIESDEAMQERAFHFLQQTAANPSYGSHILVVTHGGLMRNLLIRILALDGDAIEVKNAALLTLTYSNGEWAVAALQGIHF